MMTSSKWKIVITALVEIVLATTYRNFEENWSIFTEIHSILHKYADVIICKFEFWVPRPLWWCHVHLMAKWDMKSYLQLILYLNMKKKWRSRFIPKSYNGFCIGMFLPIYAIIKRPRAHWHLSWIYAHLVNNGHKEINMESNSLKKYEKYHERKKNGDSMFFNGVTRKNARACSYRAIFYKMLKMTWNVCKINLRRFWAFKNFARALTRGRTRTRAFFDLKLTGLILT